MPHVIVSIVPHTIASFATHLPIDEYYVVHFSMRCPVSQCGYAVPAGVKIFDMLEKYLAFQQNEWIYLQRCPLSD